MKPVISIIMGSKSDWATMQKPLKSSTTSVSLTKRKLFPHIGRRTSCSNMPKKHVAVASRSSSQVRVALLTCQVWLLLKQLFQSSGYLSSLVPLAVWDSLYSIVQMPGWCNLSQPWLSVKLVRLMQPSLPFVSSLSRRQGHCGMRLLTLLKNKEKSQRSLQMSSTKTIGIIGGGQLGQMMAISAIYMGHKVITP